MDERSRVLLTTMLGAVAGGVWGWLYLTRNGVRFRSQIEPRLDDFVRELASARHTVEKGRSAATEGWRAINDITGSASGRWSA